jgi:hypothetical protein
LSERLDEVVRLGELLGLSSDEIARRTKEAANRLSETRLNEAGLTKEIV